ncbi:MAG TPA: rhodanese-like domain-containing protein [Acidimicrobiia bacterium]|nr:rhodanese-like domain-containing protein [Acidimicrobiia bacterium]
MQVEQVPAPEWEKWIEDNDGILIDVREPYEWALGTLPGARCVRMGQIPAELDSLDPGQSILVVCRSGSRSNQVAAFLKMRGYEHTANLAGGMVALGMQS